MQEFGFISFIALSLSFAHSCPQTSVGLTQLQKFGQIFDVFSQEKGTGLDNLDGFTPNVRVPNIVIIL